MYIELAGSDTVQQRIGGCAAVARRQPGFSPRIINMLMGMEGPAASHATRGYVHRFRSSTPYAPSPGRQPPPVSEGISKAVRA